MQSPFLFLKAPIIRALAPSSLGKNPGSPYTPRQYSTPVTNLMNHKIKITLELLLSLPSDNNVNIAWASTVITHKHSESRKNIQKHICYVCHAKMCVHSVFSTINRKTKTKNGRNKNGATQPRSKRRTTAATSDRRLTHEPPSPSWTKTALPLHFIRQTATLSQSPLITYVTLPRYVQTCF